MWGALLGSWFYVYANDKITNAKTSIGGHELREFRPIIFGIILILVMITLPDGIIGLATKIRRLIRRDSQTDHAQLARVVAPGLVVRPPRLRSATAKCRPASICRAWMQGSYRSVHR